MIRAAGVTVALLGLAFLPFLPGTYDPLAVTVSAAATATAFGGLILLPLGAVWVLASRSRQYALARLAIVVGTLVGAAVVLATAAGDGSVSAAAVMLIAAVVCALRLWRHTRSAQAKGADLPRAVPWSLIAVPPVVVLGFLTLAQPIEAWSRSRVVRHAGSMIADIERYHVRRGEYPMALSSLHPDYPTGAMGVDRFRYERSGQAYNLYFEHPSTTFGVQEIVMYNPQGGQDISSHVIDLLELAPEDIRRQRGHFAAEDLPQPGWRRFLFD